MIVIGADPGKEGAVAVLEDGAYQGGVRLPLISHRGKHLIDARKLFDSLSLLLLEVGANGPLQVVIEQVGAMPGQGVTSSFSFGRSTGALEAVLLLLPDVRLNFVPPAVWKRAAGLLKQPKSASKDAARLRFGNKLAFKYEGVAEAALIAGHGWDRMRVSGNKD